MDTVIVQKKNRTMSFFKYSKLPTFCWRKRYDSKVLARLPLCRIQWRFCIPFWRRLRYLDCKWKWRKESEMNMFIMYIDRDNWSTPCRLSRTPCTPRRSSCRSWFFVGCCRSEMVLSVVFGKQKSSTSIVILYLESKRFYYKYPFGLRQPKAAEFQFVFFFSVHADVRSE